MTSMRIESLTFFRFVAAMIVVIFHFGADTGLAALSPGFLTAGSQFVTFFFVLSGFVLIIANPFDRKFEAKKFFYNRLIRITPLYLLALILSAGIFNDKVNFTTTLLSMTYLQAWFPPYPLGFNGPAWSLSAEMFFYASFPLIYFYLRHHQTSPTRILWVTIGIWVFCQAILANLISEPFYEGYPSVSFDLIHYLPLTHLPGFILGMVAALLYLQAINNEKPYTKPAVAMLIFSSLLMYYALECKDNYSSLNGFSAPFHAGFYAPLFALFILSLACSGTWINKCLAAAPLRYLGEISYGIYILQMPLYSLYLYLAEQISGLTGDLLFYSYCLFLILIAALLHQIYDMPLQRMLKKQF